MHGCPSDAEVAHASGILPVPTHQHVPLPLQAKDNGQIVSICWNCFQLNTDAYIPLPARQAQQSTLVRAAPRTAALVVCSALWRDVCPLRRNGTAWPAGSG